MGATKGLGEKTEAHGITIIVGSKDVLLDSRIGKWSALNKYENIDVSVMGLLLSKNKEKLTFLLPDFGLVGALIVDGATGRVLANGWTAASAIEPSPLSASPFAPGSFSVYAATDSPVIVPMKGLHQSDARSRWR